MNTNNGSRFTRDGRAKLINAKLQAVQGLLGKTLRLLSVRQSRSLSVTSAEKDLMTALTTVRAVFVWRQLWKSLYLSRFALGTISYLHIRTLGNARDTERVASLLSITEGNSESSRQSIILYEQRGLSVVLIL